MFFQQIKQNLLSVRGWRTPRKIVVFQSDDWGAIRTESKAGLNALRDKGFDVEACHYTRLDSLEGRDDLEALFETLAAVRDHSGRPAVFTANCLVANPAFEAIRENDFEEYVLESVVDTAARNPRTEGIVDLWRLGTKAGVFQMQSHGREHLQYRRWMADLRKGDDVLRTAFQWRICSVSGHLFRPPRRSYLAALDGGLDTAGERRSVVRDALQRFETLLGYRSRSFIPPNYVWDREIEHALAQEGVEFVQTSTAQRQPRDRDSGYTVVRHYQGELNSLGHRYMVRTAHFEPAAVPAQDDVVGLCLKQVATAFLWRKPAVISTHRVNYIGHLNPENRSRNLRLLRLLLLELRKRWPEIEFMTTTELGEEMKRSGVGL